MADQLDPAMVAQISEQIRRSMGGALVQVGSDLQKLDRISKDVVSPSGGIGKLDSMFLGMSSRILGPVGLVAGLYQVSNALSKVAADSVQLQAFSRNTGIAADNVKNMQIQLQMMGKSSEEARATVGQLAGLLNDFNTNRQGSSLSQNLLGREGGAAVIRDLNAAKNVTEQIAVILKTYQAQPTERQRRGVAEAFGMDPASIEQMVKDQNLVIYTYKASEQALAEYHRASVLFTHNIDEAWQAVTGNVIKALNDMTGGADGGAKVFEKAVDGINAAVNSLFNGRASELGKLFNFGGLKQDMDDIKAFFNWWNSIEFKKNWESATGYGKYPKGGDPMDGTGSGNGPDRIGKTSGFTFGEPGTRAADEKEQTTLLTEIRDTLQGKVGTGTTFGVDYGTGTRSGGSGGGEGGAISASGGGFRPEGGIRGSRGDRNNNPGNMKMGPLAQSFGATHADDKGFAVFPNALSGSEAQRALVTSDKYKGLTLDQFGNKYSEGNESWKNTVGKALGIGRGDVVDQNDPRLLGAIRKAEGTGNANSPGYTGGSGNGLPSAVLEEAKKVAANDGPGAVQDYIRSQGYNVNSAWCGDFAAAVVSASGGTPPKGASIASNWRKFGHQVDEPQPGDIAVRKSSRFGGQYTPTGATGSHVTIFEGADGKGRFTGIGGNQSGRRSSFPMSGYEYFRGDAETQAARARMDAAKASGTENSLNAKVQFENVPPGVKTSVESEGEIFKELQVSKSKQGEVAGGSPGQPFSGVW